MNKLDKQYQDLLQSILDYGVEKQDRTGTGTKSIFGYTIRHNMQDGFPVLTTKKMAWKTMVTELLWFLRGDTNIKFLVDNNCHIWDGDVYNNYGKRMVDIMNVVIPAEFKDKGWVKLRLDYQGKYDVLSREEFINKIKTDDEFAKTWGELGPIYGKQWRSWNTIYPSISERLEYNHTIGTFKVTQIDQIANLISDLKTNPDSRRLMVNAWNVGELDQMVLPPCHYGFQVYTRELSFEERYVILKSRTNEDPLKYSRLDNGDYDQHPKEMTTKWMNELNIPTRAISLMWNQRSVDTFLGLPFNIASYGLLLTILAKEVNMVPDELIGNLGDTHLYLNHIEQAKEQIGREPFELPTLNQFPTYEGSRPSIESYVVGDFTLKDYQSHPSIKAPLSN
jgi:thymidylate synthase